MPVMQAHQLPSDAYLLELVTLLTLASALLIVLFKLAKNKTREEIVTALGVGAQKVTKSVSEIKRKGFHVAGLLVPLVQLVLLKNGFSTADCARICWTITVVGTSMDYARLHIGIVTRNWPLRSILREHEHKQLTGGSYFSLGCTLAICECPLQPPSWVSTFRVFFM